MGEPVVAYITSVVSQIDSNLQSNCLPTDDKLDAFVSRLVTRLRQQLKHAPKKVFRSLEGLFNRKFKEFWNFQGNRKTRRTTPEELRVTLVVLAEILSASPDGIPVSQKPCV